MKLVAVAFASLLSGYVFGLLVVGNYAERQHAAEFPADLYRVFHLDIASSDAIARCAHAGGIAGWLQAIEEDGDYTGTADVYCAVPFRSSR